MKSIIIRWRYAPGASEVESIVNNLDFEALTEISREVIDFDSRDLMLFDSAAYLKEDSNAVKLQTLHKTVNITTYEYNSESVALIIHKLKHNIIIGQYRKWYNDANTNSTDLTTCIIWGNTPLIWEFGFT